MRRPRSTTNQKATGRGLFDVPVAVGIRRCRFRVERRAKFLDRGNPRHHRRFYSNSTDDQRCLCQSNFRTRRNSGPRDGPLRNVIRRGTHRRRNLYGLGVEFRGLALANPHRRDRLPGVVARGQIIKPRLEASTEGGD